MSNIALDQLASTIQNGLNLYSKNILRGVGNAAETVVKQMVQTTKQRPTKDPRARGKYARCMASQVGENSLTAQSHIWYVKDPCFRVTHLLNNGHRTTGGGHYSGDNHVTNAANKAMTEFERLVKEVIERESN